MFNGHLHCDRSTVDPPLLQWGKHRARSNPQCNPFSRSCCWASRPRPWSGNGTVPPHPSRVNSAATAEFALGVGGHPTCRAPPTRTGGTGVGPDSRQGQPARPPAGSGRAPSMTDSGLLGGRPSQGDPSPLGGLAPGGTHHPVHGTLPVVKGVSADLLPAGVPGERSDSL